MAHQQSGRIANDMSSALKEFLKPGFKMDMFMDTLSDNYIFRVYDTNSNKFMNYTLSGLYLTSYKNPFDVVDHIVNTLNMQMNCFNVTCRYEKNFERRMREILNCEVKIGIL